MFVLFFSTFAFAQSVTLSQKSADAYHSILKLRLNEGISSIKNSNLPEDIYIKQLTLTIKMLIEQDNISLNKYEKQSDIAYGIIKKSNLDSQHKKYYLAEILLQSAFVHLKHGEEFSAAWEIRKAYRSIRDNVKEYPEFIPHYKTIGLLHIMIGLIPDKYNWIVSMMGMEGTISQGIGELEKVATYEGTFSLEAQALIPFVNSYVLQNTQGAVVQFKTLFSSNPVNLLFHYFYALLLTKNSEAEKALAVIESAFIIEQTAGYSTLTTLKYMKAEILLQKGQYDQSLQWFQKFIDEHRGSNFIKDSYYKMALCQWLNGDEEKALQLMAQAAEKGVSNTEADKYAASQVKEVLPNQDILKLRFATDGGYYDLAESIVNDGQIRLGSKKDEVEFTYRKARYFHKIGKIQSASAFYKLTIESSHDSEWYFAPNAALQLGYIYQASGEFELARKYFEMVLDYKNHQYKNSIDNKAKSALSLLDAQ